VEKAEHDFSAPPAGSDYALRAPQGQSHETSGPIYFLLNTIELRREGLPIT